MLQKATGRRDPAALRARLRTLLRRLEKHYGPRPFKPRSGCQTALDVLIEAVLSQNTNMANSQRGYAMLRRELPTWSKVAAAPFEQIERQIAICGLARQRARRLQAMLHRIRADQGRLSLEPLRNLPVDAARDYLLSFHGVGPRTAAFTLLFAFNAPVLPVDNGILRVLRRLRLIGPTADDGAAERRLAPSIGPGNHYATHVLLFRHAKDTCTRRDPLCPTCPLLALCPTGQRRRAARPVRFIEVKLPPRKRVLASSISAGLPKD